ncbi:hypothetical protein AU252_01010 [Pseudarthrobacter sulfonivorans]|uniref:SMP-30/Gluconolactonase/LRE-like region domain-containing protein n=1 Tax=Pseudarthrobacter sulfonivorans TaxID=121292 RepID=A0A0U3Q3U9_9MICC|nr:SMP-30/gluconolactonase/LRE family protein [Pseudarthrobacter sulfonivorans]ALV39914.1 hypothetical protein AU252_01010 [Pseudarthrobacter sulfonivorans]
MQFDVLTTDIGFAEGPVFAQDGRIVVTSIDQGYVYQIVNGVKTVLGATGGGPNGAAEGSGGDIYVAQNGGWRPTAPGPGGALVTRWPGITGGLQAISPRGLVRSVSADPIYPNDLCFGPDGLIYLTDPSRQPSRDDGRLWRIDAETGDSELLTSVGWYPNGIGFGIEDDAVYVARSGEGQIVRFPLGNDGKLGTPETFIQLDHGRPDGFAWDAHGHLVVCCITGTQPGDLQVYDSNGSLVEVINPGAATKYTNVAISTAGQLIITDADEGNVLTAQWPYPGLPLHPFR